MSPGADSGVEVNYMINRAKHMRQKQIKSIPMLVALATTMIGALGQFAAAIGLQHITKATFEAAFNEMIAAGNALVVAKAELDARRQTLKGQAQQARSLLVTARDALKNVLGKVLSVMWEAAGFKDSFMVPYNAGKLLVMLQAMKTFLANNPTMEVPQLNVTGAAVTLVATDYTVAFQAVTAQEGVVANLTLARQQKATVLKGMVSELIRELGMKLDPLAGEWLQFGLNKPGALEIPEVPLNLVVAMTDPDKIAVKWDAAARAERYRVWVKINGVDTEFLLKDTAEDLKSMIEGLPANTKVEIAVSAINNGGESARTTVVSVTTAA
jgi:hypothetical protein